MLQKYIVYLGEDKKFLIQLFHFLGKQLDPLNIRFFSKNLSLQQQADIHFNLIQILSAHGYFKRNNFIELSWDNESKASIISELSQNSTFIPIPDNTLKTEEDIILEYDDFTIEIIEALSQNNDPISEQHIRKILEINNKTEWHNKNSWENILYKELLCLMESSILTIDLENTYKKLQNLHIQRYGFLFRWRKEIQEPSLKRLMSAPEHIGSHLVLSIFRRYYPTAPATIKHLLTEWKNKHQGYIRILPAIKTNALTYIITTYQRLEGFNRAAKHILNQSVDNWFLSILDHGSSGELQNHIQSLKKEYPQKIKIYRKDVNSGSRYIFTHLQQVIKEAPTELICFCSDDDFIWQNHAEKSLKFFQDYPWISMVYGGKQIISVENIPKFSVGPYYKKSQIINPYTELQRIIPMRSASPHFVIRKEVLKSINTKDPYVPEGATYGFLDTLSHIFAISLYEVACVNEILSSVTLDTQSAFMQEDISSVWLLMAREVIQKYRSLFTEDFPIQPVQQLLKMLFDSSYGRLWQEWESMEDAEMYQQALDIKYRFYQEAFAFKQEVLPLCSATTPFLFQDKHPYAPL